MRPVRLQLKGFTSFKDGADISFENLDRFAICGPTGAGKSSLLDALTFALFAEAPRRGTGNLANLISLGRKSFSVSLDFTAGNQTFRVTRVRRRSSAGSDQLEKVHRHDKTELMATGERAVTESVERLLGLNYGHFTQAVFLPQGKFSEFLKAKPAERRRVLNELLRLLVYERMQERAGKDRDTHGGKKAQTERRLKEDFNGVTDQARADLERQQQGQLLVVADADAKLLGLRDSWEQARQGRTWTVELEAKQAQRTRHQGELPKIEATRQAVAAANRAADVMPVLQQAETARQEEQSRQQALQQALQDHIQRRAEHHAATVALEKATEAVISLPDLRRRLDLLNVAKGKLGLRDRLIRQLEELQQRHRTLAADRASTAKSSETLANDIAAIEQDFSQARKNLDAIGFNEEHLRRLVIEQPAAVRLQSDRMQLVAVRKQAKQDEASASNLAAVADDTGRIADQEEATATSARKRMEVAEEALRVAEAAHAASHLRAGLQPGHACPVCRQEVFYVPPDEIAPELDQLRQALLAAKKHLAGADRTASQAANSFAAARALSDASRNRVESSCCDLARREKDIALCEQTLLEKLGDLLDRSLPTPVRRTDACRQAGRAAKIRHALYLKGSNLLSELQTKLALKRKDHETQGSQIKRLDEDLRVTAAKIEAEAQSLSVVRNEIYEAAGTDEPAASRSKRVQVEIDRLEAEVARTTQVERAASDRLRLAASLVTNCTQEASQASTRAAEARALAASGACRKGRVPGHQHRSEQRTSLCVRSGRSRSGSPSTDAMTGGWNTASPNWKQHCKEGVYPQRNANKQSRPTRPVLSDGKLRKHKPPYSASNSRTCGHVWSGPSSSA